MKFDYDSAWRDTTRLLTGNFGLLAVIAGIFFFVPYAALMIALPGMASFAQPDPSVGTDAMMGAMMDFYAEYWWVLLTLAVVQSIGMLAMLALLRREGSPTVGEALGAGARSVVSYLAAQILQALGLVLAIMLLLAPAGVTGSTGLAVLGGIVAFVFCVYVVTKLSLAAPIIAIEGVLNPVTALRRSWALTKGNSVRLFFFYVLLVVAFLVASMVISLVFSLIFALMGEQAALFGTAVSTSLINAAMIVLMVAVLAAVHGQLARIGASGEPVEA